MTLRERIRATLTWRITMERGGTFTRIDICRDLMPNWDSADAAPRQALRRDVGAMLHRMCERGECRRVSKGEFARPERAIVYRQPLARVPDVVREDAERRAAE